jgi:FkbM family methyltransferase
MKKLKKIRAILKSINDHPLAGKHKLRAYYKFFLWQIRGSIIKSEKKVAFTDRSYLSIKKGMTGATGNIYMGLHEFYEMAFLLHFLREGDIFFDIGANIGSYTVLASGHVAAKTFAFEPIPSTFQKLEKNIRVNGINHLVKAFNVGIGSQKDTLIFTSSLDTVNHVVPDYQKETSENTIQVNTITIDETVSQNDVPILVKIDVEGFETEVINGMKSTLSNEKLKAIIIELNGSGGRYGYNENDIHLKLINTGFEAFRYDPFHRRLNALETFGHFNTLYLRDIKFAGDRVTTADNISMFSEKF